MRISLEPTLGLEASLALCPTSKNDPPLAFIENEPFLIELQGALELPGGHSSEGVDMGGVSVGKLDTTEPHKPILQIAHHRLEGRIVTLAEPYALLRTTRVPSRSAKPVDEEAGVVDLTSADETEPKIEILGLIRRKVVFSKRPEPIITLSSDVDFTVDFPQNVDSQDFDTQNLDSQLPNSFAT